MFICQGTCLGGIKDEQSESQNKKAINRNKRKGDWDFYKVALSWNNKKV
jgi:hypothetical protein